MWPSEVRGAQECLAEHQEGGLGAAGAFAVIDYPSFYTLSLEKLGRPQT